MSGPTTSVQPAAGVGRGQPPDRSRGPSGQALAAWLAATAIRGRLGAADGAGPPPATSDVLRAVRAALGAEGTFLLRHVGPDLDVTSADPAAPAPVPAEVLTALARFVEGGGGNGTARRLRPVPGESHLHVRVAACAGAPGLELLAATWRQPPSISREAFRAVADLVGVAVAALETSRGLAEAGLRRERTRWACRIHDGLLQAVTAAVLELETLGPRIAHDAGAAAASVEAVAAELRRSLADLRELLAELSDEAGGSPAGRARGPGPALLAAVLGASARWGLVPRISVQGDLDAVPPSVLEAADTVLREGLTNVAKHAASRDVDVQLAADDGELRVEVRDGGQGFDPATATGGRHFGLALVRRRVEELGGALAVHSSPGSGTRVEARLPVAARRPPAGERGDRP